MSEDLDFKFSSPEDVVAERKAYVDRCLAWLTSSIYDMVRSCVTQSDDPARVRESLDITFNGFTITNHTFFEHWAVNEVWSRFISNVKGSGWEIVVPLQCVPRTENGIGTYVHYDVFGRIRPRSEHGRH